MTFFPILVDSMTGFKAVDPRLFYIADFDRGLALETFRYIRLPAAMPYIFSGLKIGMVSAITGVMVVEYIASNAGPSAILPSGPRPISTCRLCSQRS